MQQGCTCGHRRRIARTNYHSPRSHLTVKESRERR
jgi:hypothetical protein